MRIMTVKSIIYFEKIPGDEQILSIDTIFIKQPNSPDQCHSGDLSLQSAYKFGIAFLR
jgi:hypothetical protein